MARVTLIPRRRRPPSSWRMLSISAFSRASLSGVGQVEGGGTPVEEGRAHLVLDLPQGLAQGGLADIKLFCRGGDGTVPGNGLKIEGLLHIHIIFTTFLQHIHEIYHFGPIFIIKDFLWMSR